jgi:hypothetical protein
MVNGSLCPCGSKAPFWQSVGHFRSAPINRRVQSPSACLKGANNRTRPYERSSCTVRHANASRLAIVAYQAQGCGADVFFLRRCIRAYTAVGVRFSFRAISRAVIPVSSISRSCPSSEPVHGRPAGLGPVISSPYPPISARRRSLKGSSISNRRYGRDASCDQRFGG